MYIRLYVLSRTEQPPRKPCSPIIPIHIHTAAAAAATATSAAMNGCSCCGTAVIAIAPADRPRYKYSIICYMSILFRCSTYPNARAKKGFERGRAFPFEPTATEKFVPPSARCSRLCKLCGISSGDRPTDQPICVLLLSSQYGHNTLHGAGRTSAPPNEKRNACILPAADALELYFFRKLYLKFQSRAHTHTTREVRQLRQRQTAKSCISHAFCLLWMRFFCVAFFFWCRHNLA